VVNKACIWRASGEAEEGMKMLDEEVEGREER
jgi:hypothetical protein